MTPVPSDFVLADIAVTASETQPMLHERKIVNVDQKTRILRQTDFKTKFNAESGQRLTVLARDRER
jgi:hypothetical protein